jgi:hypothetical protein
MAHGLAQIRSSRSGLAAKAAGFGSMAAAKRTKLNMSGFKLAGFLERQQAAAKAKHAALEKFRAQPGADDPAVAERAKARRAIVEAREARASEREAARLARQTETAEQGIRAAALAKQAAQDVAVQTAREQREIADREVALEAERKVERDVRYAARKARQK